MMRRDAIVYVSLAGHEHLAQITSVRQDGSLDILVDCGGDDRLELTRIAVSTTGIPGTVKGEA